MKISSLHSYPVKSGRVIALDISLIDPLGLENDRRWVIVQEGDDAELHAGRFISQRSHPQLARLIAKPSKDKLELSYDRASYTLDLRAPTQMSSISVWKDDFAAAIYQDPVNDWLSKCLGGRVRLASLTGPTCRRRESNMREEAFDMSFADSYPILIATTASLQAINDYVIGQGEAALPMARFRPNIVINGALPWQEDSWKRIKIGEIVIECVKPCTRCIMTTLDPNSGESRGNTSLDALTKLRRSADKRLKGVLFGTNAISLGSGHIARGDKVEVIETQRPWPIA